MTIRRRAVAALAVCLAPVVLVPVASADTVRIVDPAGDVDRSESGSAAVEPRVDITAVDVVHEVSALSVTVTVSRFTALADDAWVESLALEVVLVDADDGVWFWSFVADGGGGAVGSLLSFSDDAFVQCETEASASSVRSQYVLRADLECLRHVPRSARVGVAMSYDGDPSDDDFDTPFDVAPDDDFSAAVAAGGAPIVSRVAGPDRIETSIALSADRFGPGEAPAAVLVASDAPADAVVGGPLAAARGAPLLLTGRDRLDDRVAAELDRAVGPGGAVLLLGGTDALSDAVVTDLRARGLRPRRVAGADRFATAVAVAEEIGEHAIVLIADGRTGAEGLLAGAAAAVLGGVVVLSDGASLPAATDAYLAEDPSRHVAIGLAATAAPGAERVVASSTSELSQKVLDRLVPEVRMVAVAAQASVADALAGAPHLAARGGGLLLTDGLELSAAAAAELVERKGELREVVLYGGTAALSRGVADDVMAAVR